MWEGGVFSFFSLFDCWLVGWSVVIFYSFYFFASGRKLILANAAPNTASPPRSLRVIICDSASVLGNKYAGPGATLHLPARKRGGLNVSLRLRFRFTDIYISGTERLPACVRACVPESARREPLD